MENEKKMIVDALKRYHDTSFTKGVYEHSIFGKAALLLEKDSVEVVRCKDCVYGQCEPIKRGTRVCEYYDFIVRNDYDFCSRGERRNDNAAD